MHTFSRYVLSGLLVVVLSTLTMTVACAQEPAGPPNVVLILADDLGWADLGRYGSTFHRTPHIDALASQGMTFTNAYAASPVCSPTRAALLTGRHPARLRITDWLEGRTDRPDQRLLQVQDRDALPHDEVTLAEVLAGAGYATAHVGKWHLGGEGYLPVDHGFDLNVAGNHRGYPPTYFYPYDRDGYRLDGLQAEGREGELLTERLGEEAARFIEAHRDEPFFLYLPYYAVHTPLEAKADVVASYEARAAALDPPEFIVFGREGAHRVRRLQSHPVYAAMVQSLDESVGRVLRALEENGLAGRTIVIFTSDNGGLATAQGWPTSNRPLRAGKGWIYDGGLRVPLIVRWPEAVATGTTSDAPVTSTDLLPTILELAGVADPAAAQRDGRSLVPLLAQREALEREPLFWHYPHYSDQGGPPAGAVRRGSFKLIEFFEDHHVELYDLATDPGEQRDLAVEHPERAATLRRMLHDWRRSVDAQMPPGVNPDYSSN